MEGLIFKKRPAGNGKASPMARTWNKPLLLLCLALFTGCQSFAPQKNALRQVYTDQSGLAVPDVIPVQSGRHRSQTALRQVYTDQSGLAVPDVTPLLSGHHRSQTALRQVYTDQRGLAVPDVTPLQSGRHRSQTALRQVYSGSISLEGDTRHLFLEFDDSDPASIRWGIENSGRHRLPLLNSSFDSTSGAFRGDLSFFGSESFGSMQGVYSRNQVDGLLRWQGDTLSFSLRPIQRKLTYQEEAVAFAKDDVNIQGTLVLPTKGPGPFPAIIFAHGSGPATRWWGMYWASELSKIGIATLLHDKRGCGASEGKWTQASLDDLATDVVAGIDLLAEHPQVDPTKIGIYGVSQGGWVVSRTSAMTDKLSFAIVNSGGGIPPMEEELFSYDLNMKFAGIPEAERAEGLALVKAYFAYLATGYGRGELKEKMEQSRHEAWFPVLGLDKIFVTENNRENWSWVATYDPRNDIGTMKMPVLALFGDQDHIQPSERSIRYWEQALEAAGNQDYQIEIFQGAGHGLTVGGHHTKGFPTYAEGHLEKLKDWLLRKVHRP